MLTPVAKKTGHAPIAVIHCFSFFLMCTRREPYNTMRNHYNVLRVCVDGGKNRNNGVAPKGRNHWTSDPAHFKSVNDNKSLLDELEALVKRHKQKFSDENFEVSSEKGTALLLDIKNVLANLPSFDASFFDKISKLDTKDPINFIVGFCELRGENNYRTQDSSSEKYGAKEVVGGCGRFDSVTAF